MPYFPSSHLKASASIDSADFKGLRHLQETEPQSFNRSIVLYAGRDVVAFSEQLIVVPLIEHVVALS